MENADFSPDTIAYVMPRLFFKKNLVFLKKEKNHDPFFIKILKIH